MPVAASADGSYLYFVANGVLTAAPNSRGETPSRASCGSACRKLTAGATCNLYLRHDGTTSFIAALSGRRPPRSGPTARPAAPVSELEDSPPASPPDGRWLAFMSQRPLTGYDNRDAVSGAPDQEVYLYRRRATAAGLLLCASCDPTGARPHGVLSHLTA